MKYRNITLGLLLLLALSTGCRKEMPELYNPNSTLYGAKWSTIFKSYWQGMNNNYVFWDVDSTDWDAVYTKYAPIFDTLSSEDNYAFRLANQYFKEMNSTLIDHHFALAFPGVRGLDMVRPGDNEVRSRNYYHDPISLDQYNTIIQENSDRISSLDSVVSISNKGDVFYALTYLLDNSIVYFRCSSFDITRTMRLGGVTAMKMQRVMGQFIGMAYNTPNLKGVIIDVRSNTGGNTADLDFILGPLIDKKIKMAEERTKSGLGRLDFSPWSPRYITPANLGACPDVPVVALADVNSISMADMTPLAIKSLPRGIFIGERTYGAFGSITDNNILLAGQFTDSVAATYTCSLATRTVDGEILEGKGVTPDIEVLYDPSSFNNGVDNQLERAVRYINTGK